MMNNNNYMFVLGELFRNREPMKILYVGQTKRETNRKQREISYILGLVMGKENITSERDNISFGNKEIRFACVGEGLAGMGVTHVVIDDIQILPSKQELVEDYILDTLSTRLDSAEGKIFIRNTTGLSERIKRILEKRLITTTNEQ